MCARIAKAKHLRLGEVLAWGNRDLAAALLELEDELERCHGCGLTPDEAKLVEAELHRCPTCQDIAYRQQEIPDKYWQGWRTRFKILPVGERGMWSAWARLTKDGAVERKRRLLGGTS